MNIGVSYTGSKPKHDHYLRWLSRDARVNIITLSAEAHENEGDIEQCDGLVLSGGVDIHPSYYKSDRLVYPNMPAKLYEKRDAFEAALFQRAQEKRLPVLGVCRGLQLINCLLGGTLHQDMAEKNALHKAIVTPEHRQFDKAHGLHIHEGSILAAVAGTNRLVVNSAHHQSVEAVAPVLAVNSVSDDDIIEGLEWKDKQDKPFLLCVQWHPERMHEFLLENTALAAGVLDPFFEAVTKNK